MHIAVATYIELKTRHSFFYSFSYIVARTPLEHYSHVRMRCMHTFVNHIGVRHISCTCEEHNTKYEKILSLALYELFWPICVSMSEIYLIFLATAFGRPSHDALWPVSHNRHIMYDRRNHAMTRTWRTIVERDSGIIGICISLTRSRRRW